jgi:hypothetical protein
VAIVIFFLTKNLGIACAHGDPHRDADDVAAGLACVDVKTFRRSVLPLLTLPRALIGFII